MHFAALATSFAASLTVARAALAWTAEPLSPPAIPLAVRTPYLSAWLQQGSGRPLNGVWPTFWTGTNLGWAGFIRVDGQAYSFLGDPTLDVGVQRAVQKSFKYTSTQSTFVLSAGPVDITANFLSPVEPHDFVKQSLPFSYLALTMGSTDGKSHSVQVYTDISAEWVSGDNALLANWSTSTTGGIITHQVQLQDQQVYTEVADHIQHGAAYYSTKTTPHTTFQSGQDVVVRGSFTSNGKLSNTQDTAFRAVSDRWPVFGFARDLGNVSCAPGEAVVFSVGHVRDPAIQYIMAGGRLQDRSSFFFTRYPSATAAIAAFLPGYADALDAAKALDARISRDAGAISADYEAIVALSVRQALAACELTAGKDPSGRLNKDDVLYFLKEISSDGNVNTVDVIFPAWPIFLYLNPVLGKHLLEPLFQYQASGQYPNPWSVHDMGARYPRALGHNDGLDEAMPVEESGNMLIMTLSYTQRTRDTSLLKTYSKLLDQWTQFLIQDSLIPANQLSTDDFAGRLANQTNLAIKGIVGIKAMSVIQGMLGNRATAANYSSIASSYAPQIINFATGTTGALKHFELSYGNASSWGLTYNMMADKLLGTGVFAQSVFEQQSAWYATVAQKFGVPLDTRHTYTKSDWQIWTAAIATDNATRDLFIGRVKEYVASGVNTMPLSDWYETTNAQVRGFRARPVAGGHLSLLVV